MLQYCSGSQWAGIGVGSADPPVGGPGKGFFVLTNSTYTGNLPSEATSRGLAGGNGLVSADQLCLKDLTDNDWMGKADAQARGLLTSAKVKAFLATQSGTINNAVANTEYFFAVSGDTAKGGASFTTDSSGRGPLDNVYWSGSNYFDSDKAFWAGRGAVDTKTWTTTGFDSDNWTCTDFTNATGGQTGGYGKTSANNFDRWGASGRPCNVLSHLVCMVNP